MIIALSGGLDSTTLVAEARYSGYDVFPVIFRYGQRHSKEIDAALTICKHYGLEPLQLEVPFVPSGALTDPTVPVPPLSETMGHPQPPTYVPFRNLIFASYLASIAEGVGDTHIGFGFHRSDAYGYWDTTQEFVTRLEDLLLLNRENIISVWAPFVHMTKSDIAKLAVTLGVPIEYTWSCYAGGEVPCNVCATCVERTTALRDAGVM